MANNIVKNWFGEEFQNLAPQLQELHISGGQLAGEIDVTYGTGLAGLIGKRLGKKLGLPSAGKHDLVVSISHREDGLYWNRLFNNEKEMKSIFEPLGNINNGFWIEKTGPLQVKLTVDVKDGGWHWRCLGFTFSGLPLPLWMFPESKAYKRIEDGKYQFYVGFRLWFWGDLLSYEGLLELRGN